MLVVGELVAGSLVGLAVGWLGGRLMSRVAGGSSALFAIGVVAMSVLAYAAADVVHASGFRQSPYADTRPPGQDPKQGRGVPGGAAVPDGSGGSTRKLWHASPGSSGR